MRRRSHLWTPPRDKIFWEALDRGLPNAQIADLCGVTLKQVLAKRKNEGGYLVVHYGWTPDQLHQMNTRALTALYQHHPEELGNAHDAVHSSLVRCARNARAISGIPVRSAVAF